MAIEKAGQISCEELNLFWLDFLEVTGFAGLFRQQIAKGKNGKV